VRILTLTAVTLALVSGAAAVALAVKDRNTAAAPPTTAAGVETTPAATEPCTPLPYQPCGQPVAAFTDGSACIDGHDDYDGDASNGCEAAPDAIDGSTLSSSLTANIVPATDTDEYEVPVPDHSQFRCDGTLTLTLTAPPGVTLRLEVLAGSRVLGTAVSADGEAGVAKIREPNCLHDDSGTLEARVTPVGSDRTAAAYTLSRSGSF
jgi:hypothetical protein